MALFSLVFIVGPSLVLFHSLLKNLAQLCFVLLGLIGLQFWNVSGFVPFCICELWCWMIREWVWGGGIFCKFLLVKLSGLTVWSVKWCKAICHWLKPVNVVRFYMKGTSWEVVMFFTSEINNMCTIFTACNKFNNIPLSSRIKHQVANRKTKHILLNKKVIVSCKFEVRKKKFKK